MNILGEKKDSAGEVVQNFTITGIVEQFGNTKGQPLWIFIYLLAKRFKGIEEHFIIAYKLYVNHK